MNSEIDLKKLWSGQSTHPPSVYNIQKKVNAYKKTRLWQTLILNTVLILTVIMVVFIWKNYTSNYISTKIGMVLIVAAIAVYVISTLSNLKVFQRVNHSMSNQEYLNSLLKIKKKQKFLQTKIMSLYFAFLALGMGLYMFEYALMMSFFWAIFAYIAASGWVIFAWFYLRPRQIIKQNSKLDEIIKQLTEVQQQFGRE